MRDPTCMKSLGELDLGAGREEGSKCLRGTQGQFGKMKLLWTRRSAPEPQTLGTCSGHSLTPGGCPLDQVQRAVG